MLWAFEQPEEKLPRGTQFKQSLSGATCRCSAEKLEYPEKVVVFGKFDGSFTMQIIINVLLF